MLLRPEADSPALTGLWQAGFPGETPYHVFRYGAIRVWQLPGEKLLSGGVGTLPLAPISAVTEAALPGIIEKMERRLRGQRLRDGAAEVWSAVFILLGLRYSQDVARRLLRGVRSMKESVTYQAIVEEGEAKGALAEARKVVRLLGEDLWGLPDARSAAAIRAVTDLGQLEQLIVRLPRCRSWAELLQGLPPRRPRRRQR